MKKNMLFSLALCAGLLLPTANFGSESQGWYNWARQGLSRGAQTLYSYMPQWQDLSRWATNFINRLSDERKQALAAALYFAGYSTYNVAPYESKNKVWHYQSPGASDKKFINTRQESPEYIKLKNIAIFLFKNSNMLDQLSPITSEQRTPFYTYVIPAMKDLLFRGQLPGTIKKDAWLNFIDSIKENEPEIALIENNEHYLLILEKFAQASNYQDIARSINNALQKE
jgi:hypothetical protein